MTNGTERSSCWIILIICIGLAVNVWSVTPIVSDENGPLSEVQTAVGLEAGLPCDLIPASMAITTDKVQLVIWYKEGSEKPIYTFDARGKPLQQAVHWADQILLKTKAQFYYDLSPPVLRIKSVQREDAGLYRCRVDFQKSPTRNSRINLTVLVPPTKLIILDDQGGAVIDNIIGPYRETTSVNITCLSSGGYPSPRVSWWREHALLDDSFQNLPDGSVRNVLHLTRINRRDLHTVFTCQASNGHVVPPLSSTVKLEMKLPPLFVRLQGLNHPLVAGLRTLISCSSAGARPSPQIIWHKGGSIMRGATQTTSADGNVTISELVFLPAPEDNTKLVSCSVTTETIVGGAGLVLKDTRILDIKHAPIVSLSLGAPLDPKNLMKNSDVYLECDIKANPAVKKVEWFHNDKQLHSSRGVIISNQTLVLQGITKATHGQYMCRGTNVQGTVNSNDVYLDVKYPPVCKLDSQVIRAAIKQTVNVSCEIDSNPGINLTYKWYFNNTLENIIELPSIIPEEINSRKNELLYHEGIQTNLVYNSPNKPNSIITKTNTGRIYPYKIESFSHFGTVTCNAENSIGQSGPCLYHILAAELPEPVKNCSAFNSTASTVQLYCIPGKDGGIPQQFHVETIDLTNRVVLYNVSFKNPNFILKRLPSDTDIIIKVTSYNLQGASTSFRIRTKTLPAPLLRTASSTAVLVQLTPLLGGLVGVVATLLLIAVCIVAFIKIRSKKVEREIIENNVNERDKGSSEPLSRNMGSHSSIDDKNPDVVPQENSEDEEKAFDRLKMDTHRILYTPGLDVSPTPQLSPTTGYTKQVHNRYDSLTGRDYLNSLSSPFQYGELSLTTNPTFAVYNSPSPTRHHLPLYQSPTIITTARSPPNIYTRIPSSRNYLPYDTRAVTTTASTTTSLNDSRYGGVTIPLLTTNNTNGIITTTTATTNMLDDRS